MAFTSVPATLGVAARSSPRPDGGGGVAARLAAIGERRWLRFAFSRTWSARRSIDDRTNGTVKTAEPSLVSIPMGPISTAGALIGAALPAFTAAS